MRLRAVVLVALLTTSTLAMAQAESPNGTRVPPAASITDVNDAVWTLYKADPTSLLGEVRKNGVSFAGGQASELLYCNHLLYALNPSGAWQATTTGWTQVSPTPTCDAAPPASTAPTITSTSVVSWGASPDAVDGYYIYVDNTRAKTVSATTLSTLVPTMTEGLHGITVSAFKGSLESARVPSPPVAVTFSSGTQTPTAPQPPTNVSVR